MSSVSLKSARKEASIDITALPFDAKEMLLDMCSMVECESTTWYAATQNPTTRRPGRDHGAGDTRRYYQPWAR
jgi:hypothetical protein